MKLSDWAEKMLNMATTLEEMAKDESLPMADHLKEGTVQDIKIHTHGRTTALVKKMCKRLSIRLQSMADTFFPLKTHGRGASREQHRPLLQYCRL